MSEHCWTFYGGCQHRSRVAPNFCLCGIQGAGLLYSRARKGHASGSIAVSVDREMQVPVPCQEFSHVGAVNLLKSLATAMYFAV